MTIRSTPTHYHCSPWAGIYSCVSNKCDPTSDHYMTEAQAREWGMLHTHAGPGKHKYPFHEDGTLCEYESERDCNQIWHFIDKAAILAWRAGHDIEGEQRDGNVGELIDGRVNVYGDPVKVFIRHAQVWSGILGVEVQPWQVALCMMGYKMVRTAVTPDYSDNSDDIDGYKDIFTKLIGEDMIHARDTASYLAGGGKGAR